VNEITKYELLLLTFIGAIMANSGCDRPEALRRIATLMTLTEDQLKVRASDGPR
jgi:hypothetical protein